MLCDEPTTITKNSGYMRVPVEHLVPSNLLAHSFEQVVSHATVQHLEQEARVSDTQPC